MTMIEKRCNLFHHPCRVKVITINMVGGFGAGLARKARDTIPGIHQHYLKMFRKITPNQFISYKHDGVIYLMVPTKINWRDPSPIELVEANIVRLAQVCLERGIPDIVVPKMGCSNGQLDYDRQVRPLFCQHFEEHPTNFHICL